MTTKTFDSVKLMRRLRDELSQELERMTPEERIRYIRERAASTSLGRALAKDRTSADPGRDAADDASRRR